MCHLLLFEFQEDFYAVVDWAYKIDPLRCISMHGITERYLSGQKADAAGFVRLLLGDLESRISMQFGRVCFCYCQKNVVAICIKNFMMLTNFIHDLCSLLMKLVTKLKEMSVMYGRWVSYHTSQGTLDLTGRCF